LAEAGLWDAALTDAEVAILGVGYSPLFVRPQSLVAYWPLVRDAKDRVGGYDLTAGGGPVVAAHPRIIYPSPQFVPRKIAAAAAAAYGRQILSEEGIQSRIFGGLIIK